MDNLINDAKLRNRSKRDHFIKNQEEICSSTSISNLFTRTLLSVILILIVAIYTNMSDKNLLYFKDNLFNETLSFTKINNLYTKYFGNITPENKSIEPVFSSDKEYSSIEPYHDSYKVYLNAKTFTYLESGIVVFAGTKEDLGNTVIVQGVDGTDIWYSNLESINVTLYDYIEKNTIVGEFASNTLILTLMENNTYKSYEGYLS